MTLETAKHVVTERFLGRLGLHGVGLRRKDDAVCLYIDATAREDDVQALVGDVRREIAPHQVVVIREAPATLA